jgi:hypothetical protein
MAPHLTSADTLRLATGQPVVVTRTPLVIHPPAQVPDKLVAPRGHGVH